MSYQPQNRNITTGVISGCEVTLNGTLNFDISAGTIAIEDWTNPSEMRLKVLTYPGVIAQAPLLATTKVFTLIALVESSTEGVAELLLTSEGETNGQTRRQRVALSSIIHPNNDAIISSITEDYQIAFGWAQVFNDMNHCRKACVSGNLITSNGANLLLSRSEGTTSLPFFNASSSQWLNSSTRTNEAQTTQIFIYQAQEPAGIFVTGEVTSVDPNNFDDNGSITSVQGGKWTNQRVYFFGQSSTMTIAYGQREYTQSLEEALLAIETEDFIDPINTATGIWIATITAQQGNTDLSDTINCRITNRKS